MEEKINKKISDLMIIDVLQMPLFYDKVSFELKDIWHKREKARKKLKRNERLQAHPIDKLYEEGYLEPNTFIIEYNKILDSNSELHTNMRDVIKTIGNTAFNKTMKVLLEE